MPLASAEFLPDSPEHPQRKRRNEEQVQQNRKRIIVRTERENQNQKKRHCGEKPLVRRRTDPAENSDHVKNHCQNHEHHGRGEHAPVIAVVRRKCSVSPVKPEKNQNSCQIQEPFDPTVLPEDRHGEEEHSGDHARRHDQHPAKCRAIRVQRRHQHVRKRIVPADSEQFQNGGQPGAESVFQ